jgi:hypothetical protein
MLLQFTTGIAYQKGTMEAKFNAVESFDLPQFTFSASALGSAPVPAQSSAVQQPVQA